MAYTKLMETKDGKKFYRIFVARGYGKTPYSKRWYVPEGKAQRTIDRELSKAVAEFELECSNKDIPHNREQQKAAHNAEIAELKKIQTVRQYGDQVFMPELMVTCSEHTRANFRGNLDKHIYPVIGDIRLTEVTSEQITALLLALQTSGLKVSSVIKIYTILNMLFKRAYLSRTIPHNPMDFVQRPKATKAEGKDTTVQAFTGEELVYILKCMENEPLVWRLIVRMMIDTGARKGEILGLEWKNINLDEHTITISQNLCYTPAKGIYTDTPKSGKSRTICITDDEIIALLKEWRVFQRNQIKVFELHPSTDFVFTQDDGVSPMHPDSPTRRFKKYADKYGIKDFHPHKLRHSFASVSITHGADIASVSEKLGHADKGTTLRMYTHSDMDAQRRASEIFRNALNEKQA